MDLRMLSTLVLISQCAFTFVFHLLVLLNHFRGCFDFARISTVLGFRPEQMFLPQVTRGID
jgi:hypothetical protein